MIDSLNFLIKNSLDILNLTIEQVLDKFSEFMFDFLG
jgi:hypothetical protein